MCLTVCPFEQAVSLMVISRARVSLLITTSFRVKREEDRSGTRISRKERKEIDSTPTSH